MEAMDLFDVIGPVMVGPSSSHTAGAIRLGLLARTTAGFPISRAIVELHGSFAETGKGHGTDLGLVAGLLGWAPDDARLQEVARHAAEQGLKVEFRCVDLGQVHPNTVRFQLEGPEGQRAVVQGSSVGGGAVIVTELNGWPVELAGLYETLLVAQRDTPGVIANITAQLSAYGLNIATMRVARRARGGEAMTTVELDDAPPAQVVEGLKALPEVFFARHVSRL